MRSAPAKRTRTGKTPPAAPTAATVVVINHPDSARPNPPGIGFLTRYASGQLPHWVIFWVLLPIYTLSAVVTPFVTASRYPEPFDFRYRVITNLASWRDNPGGHRLFGLGLGVMMLCLVPFAGHLRRNLGGSAALRRAGQYLLWVGIAGGMVLSVESGAVAGLRNLWGLFGKAHELYAILAFAGLGFGGVAFGICTIQTALLAGAAWRSARVLLPTGFLVLMLGSCLLQLALYLMSYIAGWDRENGGRSFLLNFAFWEWMSVAGMLLLLQTLGWEACTDHSHTSCAASNTGPSTHTRL